MPPGEPVDICLISPGLPSSNPRLVKEATALVEAGYRVHCVVGDYSTPLRMHDEQLLMHAGATWTRVGFGNKWSYRQRRLGQWISGLIAPGIPCESIVVGAISTQVGMLAKAAAKVPARLYIGHTLAGLPAAVQAARQYGVIAGFDAEDLHSEETGDPRRDRLAYQVERLFLRKCSHFTAASPLIAKEYRRRHQVEMMPILNTFPLMEFSTDSVRPSCKIPSLYWFSQTIGPGRGLEQIILALGYLDVPCRLALRGIVSELYRAQLQQLAQYVNRREALQFLPPAAPDQMVLLAAEHDIGLSIENRTPINRDSCLTNKIFTYLAAGRFQILSKTSAHQHIAAELGDGAALVDLNYPRELAEFLSQILANPQELLRRSVAAQEAAARRFHWNYDANRLVHSVEQILPRRDRSRERLQHDDKSADFAIAHMDAARRS